MVVVVVACFKRVLVTIAVLVYKRERERGRFVARIWNLLIIYPTRSCCPYLLSPLLSYSDIPLTCWRGEHRGTHKSLWNEMSGYESTVRVGIYLKTLNSIAIACEVEQNVTELNRTRKPQPFAVCSLRLFQSFNRQQQNRHRALLGNLIHLFILPNANICSIRSIMIAAK